MNVRWCLCPVVEVANPDGGKSRWPLVNELIDPSQPKRFEALDDPHNPGEEIPQTLNFAAAIANDQVAGDVCLVQVWGGDFSKLDAEGGITDILEQEYSRDLRPLLEPGIGVKEFGALGETPRQRGWSTAKLGRLHGFLRSARMSEADIAQITEEAPIWVSLQAIGRQFNSAFDPRIECARGSMAHNSTVIFDDPLTDTNGTKLYNHTPNTTGTGWTQLSSPTNPADELEIQSNTATPGGSGASVGELVRVDDAASSADYDMEFDLVNDDPSGDDPICLAGRVTASNNYYLGYIESGTGYRIMKNVTGTRTLITSATGTNYGAPSTLTFECRDALKDLKLGGTSELSTSDNAITATGFGGVGTGNITEDTGDDISTTWEFDNFTVTDQTVVGGGGTPIHYYRRRNMVH